MVTVEERESALKAKVNHLDEILRTAQMASYLYTRVRWSLSPSELPVDNGGIDDWHQKFIVLEGSSIYFYPRATDLSPEGAILFNEVVDVGPTTGQIHGDEESLTWFGFHITTCHGFHLECATMLKMQAELWVSLIQSAWMDQKGH
ncbi:hypothetical protein KP509_13G080000 [Ceratopteris richardii]|nr:hypothetical protein KP509_13G080000 [Ceratopteris richardii]